MQTQFFGHSTANLNLSTFDVDKARLSIKKAHSHAAKLGAQGKAKIRPTKVDMDDPKGFGSFILQPN